MPDLGRFVSRILDADLATVVAIVGLVLVIAFGVWAELGGGGGTFADDMNHACTHHHGVFSFNAQQGGGVCRDGTAVAP